MYLKHTYLLKKHEKVKHYIITNKKYHNHYENTPILIYWKFYHQKKEKLQIKNSDILHISAQNIDCGYSLEPPLRGGSNEYPQSMFLSRNKKNNIYPCKLQFYYIKVGFKGSKLYRHVLVMESTALERAAMNYWGLKLALRDPNPRPPLP